MQGQAAKKGEVATLLDELRDTGESFDILTLKGPEARQMMSGVGTRATPRFSEETAMATIRGCDTSYAEKYLTKSQRTGQACDGSSSRLGQAERV